MHDNPKGQLYELCARRDLEAPSVTFSCDGAEHVASMQLTVSGRRVESGEHRAPSRKQAERLAVLALLALLAEGDEAAALIDAQHEEILKAKNPKGRLLELCAQSALAQPSFSTRPVVGGFLGHASLLLADGQRLLSERYRGRSLKAVEQAAADELLTALIESDERDHLDEHDALDPHVERIVVADESPATLAREAKQELNELRQRGYITDFGYEELSRSGPAHKLSFVVRGWVEGLDGERRYVGPGEFRSLRDATATLAPQMLALADAIELLDDEL